jgi:hypothetical protein
MQRVNVTNVALVAGLALALAPALGGCSSGLLGGGGSKSATVPSNNVQVGNQLALPPDLALRAPSAAPAYGAATAPGDEIYGSSPASLQPAAPGQLTRGQAAAQNGTQGDIYDQYGISKFKPDGTRKAEWELKAELKAAILKRKRQTNPGYGTVFNMGGLFSDN